MSDNQISFRIAAEDAYSQVMKNAQQAMNDLKGTTGKVSESFMSLKEIIGPVIGLLGAFSLGEIVKESYEAAVKMEQLNIQFKAITGSAAMAKESMDFVWATSQRLGLQFEETAASFAKFSLAAKGTSLEGEGARKVFAAFAEEMVALQAPSDKVQEVMGKLSLAMSRGTISARELRTIATVFPDVYRNMATAMGLTEEEFQKQIKSGTVMTGDILPKLAAVMHNTWGEAANEGAQSATAQMTRFKNELIETSAKIGEAVLPILRYLMDVFGGIAGTVNGVIDILGPAAPVAIAFALAIGAIGLAQKALTAEVIASTAAMLVNPVFLLIAAGSVAILGIAAGIKAIAGSMGMVNDEAVKDSTAARLKKEQDLAAEKKKLLEDYDSAMGDSLQVQLKKEDDAYNQRLEKINSYYDSQIAAANGDAAKIADIEKRQAADTTRLLDDHLQKEQDLRNKDLDNQDKFYKQGLTLAIAHAKALGDTTAQNIDQDKLNLDKQIEDIKKYYAGRISLVKGSIGEEVALEAARDNEIAAVKVQHNKDYLLRGFAAQKMHLDQVQEAANSEIEIIKDQVAKHIISEEAGQAKILAMQKEYATKNLEIAAANFAIIAEKYGPNTDQYKKALKEKEAATKTYWAADISQANNAETQKAKNLEIALLANKNILDKELNYQQQNLDRELESQKDMLRNGVVSQAEYQANVAAIEADYRVKFLQAEEDKAARVLAIAQKELADKNPETQKKEYQDALTAQIGADTDYNAKHSALVDARKERDAKAEDAITQKHQEGCDKRKTADALAAAEQQKLVTKTYLMWDNAVNGAAASVKGLSDAAYNAWAGMTNQPLKVAESIDSVRAAAGAAGDQMLKMWKDANTPMIVNVGWVDFYKQLRSFGVAAADVTSQFLNQKLAAMELTDQLTNVKFANLGIVQAATNAVQNMKLLDDATLSKLKSEIERVKGVFDSFRQSVAAAVASVRDELEQMTLDAGQLETKRYEKQVAALQDQIKQAAEMQDQTSINQLQQAITDAQKLHDLKMKMIQTEADAQKAANKQTAQTQTQTTAQSPVSTVGANGASPSTGATTTTDAANIATAIKTPLQQFMESAQARADVASTVAVKSQEQLNAENLAHAKKYNDDQIAWWQHYGDVIANMQTAYTNDQKATLERVAKIIAAYSQAVPQTLQGGPKMARGGQLPGDSMVDSLQVWARPGEWFVSNESGKGWGPGFMQGIVEGPMSEMGRQIQARMNGLRVPQFDMSSLISRTAYATGGPVTGGSTTNNNPTINLYISVPDLEESMVRRKIIPVLEKYARLKK
jgi:tape measure domain-containing protein